MRSGKDSAHTCPSCGRKVLVSEVVTWRERDRIYWFLTGICERH
jgi:DNA-directed RNA polymerase subunit RPC12/RpoP